VDQGKLKKCTVKHDYMRQVSYVGQFNQATARPGKDQSQSLGLSRVT